MPESAPPRVWEPPGHCLQWPYATTPLRCPVPVPRYETFTRSDMSTPRRRGPHKRLRALAAGLLIAGTFAALPAGTAHAAAGCQVTYTVRSQWPTGFTGDLVVKNLGDALTS